MATNDNPHIHNHSRANGRVSDNDLDLERGGEVSEVTYELCRAVITFVFTLPIFFLGLFGLVFGVWGVIDAIKGGHDKLFDDSIRMITAGGVLLILAEVMTK